MGVGSVQNVLQERMGLRQTVTGSAIMAQLRVQLLTETVTHFGLVPLVLMLTPDLQHGQCSCRQ
jgi:Cu/Ag efflux pump CusA